MKEKALKLSDIDDFSTFILISSMLQLKNLTHPKLLKTAKRIQQYRKAGYQELLLEDMVEDIMDGTIILPGSML